MAAVVAWFVPRIGQTLLLGFGLGVVLAVSLILRRRKAGPMPSSGRRAGANSTLSIERPMTPEDDDNRLPPGGNMRAEPARHAL